MSPPTSPRMSDTPAKAPPYHWQQPQYVPVTPNVPHGDQNESLQHFKDEASNVGDQSRPPLRTYKSFPYSLGPSSRFAHDATHSTSTEQQIGTAYSERLVTFGPQPTGSSDLQPATYGGSAPTSPAGRLTPQSGAVPASNEQVDEDEEIEMDDLEGGEGEEKPPMTAAELRAAKRKMKRFRCASIGTRMQTVLTWSRLTHNQTRFLMSEFARQAHPDAAHRERLSREIPGLSPRQVQVWFQNRSVFGFNQFVPQLLMIYSRAKLKRMTTDDRDRMMRSRALPENFDMTQALHSPFGGTQPPMGTPMPTPGAFSQFGGGDVAGVRPLTLDTLRRVPDYDNFGQHNQYTSPTGISPALGAFTFTPPHSATETVSPGSATGDMTSFGFQHRPQDSPRRPPFGFNGMPLGAPSPGFGSHQPQMPRLGFDRFTRPESVSSPLRTSMSYSSLGNGSTQPNQAPERSSSFSEQSLNSFGRTQQHRSLTNPASAGPGPYGLGFTCTSLRTTLPC